MIHPLTRMGTFGILHHLPEAFQTRVSLSMKDKWRSVPGKDRVRSPTVREGSSSHRPSLLVGLLTPESNYIFPDFMLATRFSKLVVSTLSALPLAIATSAAASASSFRPAAQSRLAFADRFLKVSLTLID